MSTIKHSGPSSISIDSLLKTFSVDGCFDSEFIEFATKAGVPRVFLQEFPKLVGKIEYNTAFISYGSPDEEKAKSLQTQLEAKGVSAWLYCLHRTPGESTWHEINEKRMNADRMILLCSIDALMRDGVKKEIEEQIDENADKLIPVSLEPRWKQKGFEIRRGDRDLKPFLEERNYANFEDPANYEDEFKKLLSALRRKKSTNSLK